MLLSEHHYDGTCRSAAAEKGLLRRHDNYVRFSGKEADLEINFQNADLLLKICEGVQGLSNDGTLTKEDMEEVRSFAKTLNRALSASETVSKNWEHDLAS